MTNFSYGGLGIELEGGSDVFGPGVTLIVNVEYLGEFEAEVRWSRANRIGVLFTDEDGARQCIQDYLNANGLTLA